MSTIRTSNFGPLTGNTASVVDPSTPTNGIARVGTLVSFASVASTSGTSIDFIGIPSWARRITVMFNGVSTNGTANYLVQIGAGSITSSGYSATSSYMSSGVATTAFTAGFGLANPAASAATVFQGHVIMTLLGSNIWVASGVFGESDTARTWTLGGTVTLGGSLDRVRITTSNGTDAFDAGSVNVMYE